MTQIKSEKALQILEASLTSGGHVLYETAHKAIEIAEIEAVEHYAKELQELRDKAVEVFDSIIGATNFYNSNNDNFWDLKEQFIQKLNEK